MEVVLSHVLTPWMVESHSSHACKNWHGGLEQYAPRLNLQHFFCDAGMLLDVRLNCWLAL